MGTGGSEGGRSGGKSKLHAAVEIFLESAQTLADSPDQLAAAVQFGMERIFDELVREACREVGLRADAFSAQLAQEAELQALVQGRLAELFSSDTLSSARGQTVRKEAERQLQVYRFVLSGEEPEPWVWNAMDRSESARLRAYREAGGDEDDELLLRVNRALEKVGKGTFARCEDCSREITPDRLSLVPWAERCVSCELRRERPEVPGGPHRVPVRYFFEGGQPVDPDEAMR